MRGFEFGEKRSCRGRLAQETAQDGVHKAGLGPKAIALGQLDRLVNGGVVGDAVEPENLVEPEAQQVLQARFLWPALGFSRDEPVERGLPAHDPQHEFMAQPAIGGG